MRKSIFMYLLLLISVALSAPTVDKEIEGDLSVDKAYKHMTFLVEEVG